MYREARRRVRWITPEQAQRLLRELPTHQADIVVFALSTGLRQANVLRLEWSQVDLERRVAWIHADQAKARRPIHVSLNSTALAALVDQHVNYETLSWHITTTRRGACDAPNRIESKQTGACNGGSVPIQG
ncbi:MAG: tyrosine-type recombinase/integrase [Opitutaceae bacterium]